MHGRPSLARSVPFALFLCLVPAVVWGEPTGGGIGALENDLKQHRAYLSSAHDRIVGGEIPPFATIHGVHLGAGLGMLASEVRGGKATIWKDGYNYHRLTLSGAVKAGLIVGGLHGGYSYSMYSGKRGVRPSQVIPFAEKLTGLGGIVIAGVSVEGAESASGQDGLHANAGLGILLDHGHVGRSLNMKVPLWPKTKSRVLKAVERGMGLVQTAEADLARGDLSSAQTKLDQLTGTRQKVEEFFARLVKETPENAGTPPASVEASRKGPRALKRFVSAVAQH